MGIEHLCRTAIKILRYKDLGSDLMAFATVTSAMAHIQPATDSKRSIAEGVFGKQFRIYVDVGKNIQQGDRIRDIDCNEYTVVAGGESPRSFGSISYTLLLVEKTK